MYEDALQAYEALKEDDSEIIQDCLLQHISLNQANPTEKDSETSSEEESEEIGFTCSIEKLGTTLRTIRMQNGLKQNEIAELLQIDQPHISRIERGELIPSINLLVKFANVLNLDFRLQFNPKK